MASLLEIREWKRFCGFYRVRADIHYNRGIGTADCVHQFYQSHHCKVGEKGEGSRDKKSNRVAKKIFDPAISCGVGISDNNRCIFLRVISPGCIAGFQYTYQE